MPPIATNQHKKIHVRIIAIILLLVVGVGAYMVMIRNQQQKDRFLEQQQAILQRLDSASTDVPRLSPTTQAALLGNQTNGNTASEGSMNTFTNTGLPK